MHDLVMKVREHTAPPWFLVMPDSKFVQSWDMVTLVALLFTATITPYEVAVLSEQMWNEARVDPLFWINRLVDSIFLGDMGLSFCMAYREKVRAARARESVAPFAEI